MKTIISQSKNETLKFGENLAKKFTGNEIIFLSGILGAGKTVVTKGIARGLKVKSSLPSPTFNIFRVYDCVYSNGNKGQLYHFDCYRLEKYSDLQEIGWEDIMEQENATVVLEWPETIKNVDLIRNNYIKNVIRVSIDIEGSDRMINLVTRNR